MFVLSYLYLLFSVLSATELEASFIRHVLKRATSNSNDGCNAELVARQQTASFTSPGYPMQYANDVDCYWQIRTSPENQIIISFASFDVEYQRNCQYDYLLIYDGPDKNSPMDGPYCGHITPADFTSTTSHIYIHFHSDTSDAWGGFEIEYRVSGNGGGDEAYGSGVGVNTENGQNGGVDWPNGDVDGSGNNDSDVSVLATVISETNGYTTQDPRNLQETIEVTGCNQIRRNARHGNITSPDYPSSYPNNADCTTVIMAPPDQGLELTFHSFDLEEFYCTFDYVLVLDSTSQDAEPVGTFCGMDIPPQIMSPEGVLVIKFVSDSVDQRAGFRASFVSYEPTQTTNVPTTVPDIALEFVRKPVDMTDLQLGDTVEQECSVNIEGAVVRWFKKESTDKNNLTELPKGEVTDGILVVEAPRGSKLIIDSMESKHQGAILCQAQLPDKSPISAAGVLEVAESSSLGSPDYLSENDFTDFETVPEDAIITDGTDHILTCSVTGDYHLVWEKNDRPLNYKNRIYLIFADNVLIGDARIRDSGTYACVAYNEDGERLGKASAQLTVTSGLDVEDVCGTVTSPEARDEEPAENYRIVNGKTAAKGSSPWMARLWYKPIAKHFCGGSLINNRWVVTAAHCITTNNLQAIDIEVRLGDHDSLTIESSEIKFGVSQIVLYDHFNYDTFDGDIALLELDERVPQFTDYVSPICLPKRLISERLLISGSEARVSGWGRLREYGAYPQFLRELRIPIVAEDTCRQSSNEPVTSNMFCAGFSQASQGDACQGDSGGPLAMKKGGKWYLLGIISWGEGCAEEGKYGFYTKVSNFISWMSDTMQITA